MYGVSHRIQKAVGRMKPGAVFPVNRLMIDLASRNAAEKELSRLVTSGRLQRVRRGVYYKPAQSHLFGNVLPDPTDVAYAIAGSVHAQIVPHGSMALHLLGLSPQVPMKQIYLNDKLHKTEWVGNTPIQFKRVSPKKLSGAGQKAGLVLSALEYLGKEQAQDKALRTQLRSLLNPREKNELTQAAQTRARWVQETTEAITDETH